MELSELSLKLDGILSEKGEQGILEVLSILMEIIADIDKTHEIRMIRGGFEGVKNRYDIGEISYDVFALHANRCRNYIFRIIFSQDDQWIMQDWENNGIVLNLMQAEEEIEFQENDIIDEEGKNHVSYEKDPDNEIAIPKDKIVIPDDLKSLMNEEEQKLYRRNLTNAQNSIRCGDFSIAYEICSKISNELESDSVQLQELLLISYFKKIGVKEIIRDYLEGNGVGAPAICPGVINCVLS